MKETVRHEIRHIMIAAAMLLMLLTAFQLSEMQQVFAADDDIDADVYRNVPWRITSDYKLIIGVEDQTTEFAVPEEDPTRDSWPWHQYSSSIEEIQFVGEVIGNGNMRWMFGYCTGLKKVDLEGFDSFNVTDILGMFYECSSLEDIDCSSFDTTNVEYMDYMFYGCSSLKSLDLSSFETSNVKELVSMFWGCSSLKSLDLSSFDTSGVNAMEWMFKGCTNLDNIALGSDSLFSEDPQSTKWQRYKTLEEDSVSEPVINTLADYTGEDPGWYSSCTYRITFHDNGGNGSPAPQIKARGVDLRLPTQAPFATEKYFMGWAEDSEATEAQYMAGGLFSADKDTDLYAVWTSMTFDQVESGMFCDVPWTITSDHELIIGEYGQAREFNMYDEEYGEGWPWEAYADTIEKCIIVGNVIGNEDLAEMFKDLKKVQTIDLRGLDTSNVTWMPSMFAGCESLTSLDLSTLDTHNVESMNSMFEGCKKLQTIDFGNIDTSNVTDMINLFFECKALQSLDLSSLNTQNVTDMSGMFSGCRSLEAIDVGGFDTSNVISMCEMFDGCASLETLDLSTFDTQKVEDMQNMFNGCKSLQSLDLTSFDAQSLDNEYCVYEMFTGCDSLAKVGLGEKMRLNFSEEQTYSVGWGRYQSLDGESVSSAVLSSIYDYNGKNPGWYRPVVTSFDIYVAEEDCYYPEESQPSIQYTGKAIKPGVEASSGFAGLYTGEDYTVSYSNNVNVGTAKITIEGKGFYSGSVTRNFKIIPRKLKAANITVTKQAVFTGKKISPKVTVKVGKTTLKKGRDYTVTYSNNKSVGLAKVVVQGKGNYGAKITKTFRILPPKINGKVKASKFKGGKTKIVITMSNKPKCKVTCYQVQIAKNKKFTKGLIVVTPKAKGKQLLMNGKLKKGKKYYIRVRALTTVKGKDYKGAWSKIKTIKGK